MYFYFDSFRSKTNDHVFQVRCGCFVSHPVHRRSFSEYLSSLGEAYKSPVCFGARSSQYGRFTYPRNIFVSSFMLVHRTGSVTCNKKQYSYWGCASNHPSLNVVLTNHQNQLLAPAATNGGGWYNLGGYTSSSSALVFCAPKKPHCIFANTELRLWYGEDLRGHTESDNGGRTCADVYGLLA